MRKLGRRQFNLRIHGDLRNRLKKAAKENGVSINAETTKRLELSFEPESERLGRIADMVAERIVGRLGG